MFEIWGTLNGRDASKDNRLSEYFTRVLSPEEEKNILFVPPSYSLWQKRIETEPVIILTFKHFRYQNSPYVTLNQLKTALSDFLPVKEKTLIELSATSEDFNLKTGKSIPLSLNIAHLKAGIKCSEIFFDESVGASYFTYDNGSVHLVWVEDTRAIALKHNLIKSLGFKGIYWQNPYPLIEGNWEALTAIYKKA
ncbi:MAG: hypothetical protein IJN39_05945 [Clostridia bacterium]|nr:hypothetical protein [Clostridia bacterium]